MVAVGSPQKIEPQANAGYYFIAAALTQKYDFTDVEQLNPERSFALTLDTSASTLVFSPK